MTLTALLCLKKTKTLICQSEWGIMLTARLGKDTLTHFLGLTYIHCTECTRYSEGTDCSLMAPSTACCRGRLRKVRVHWTKRMGQSTPQAHSGSDILYDIFNIFTFSYSNSSHWSKRMGQSTPQVHCWSNILYYIFQCFNILIFK